VSQKNNDFKVEQPTIGIGSVSFRYPGRYSDFLKGLSFQLEPERIWALCPRLAKAKVRLVD